MENKQEEQTSMARTKVWRKKTYRKKQVFQKIKLKDCRAPPRVLGYKILISYSGASFLRVSTCSSVSFSVDTKEVSRSISLR